ncbi:MAG: aminopeptidase P N-terminal domain-containing protein, partial [Bacilli bacterium]|nr:aminopeptidase P N-terminal domain-containing protein [Bacilli bacterium]
MNQNFFINNRNHFCQLMKENSLAVFFSGRFLQKTADQEYAFEVDKNFYYLCGINQANVILTISKKNNEIKETLFIEENDEVLVKWVGWKLKKEEAMNISGISQISYVSNFENYLFGLFNNSRYQSDCIRQIYLNLERRNTEGYTNQAIEFSKDVITLKYPEVVVMNAYEMVLSLRAFKSNEEIEFIKSSIQTTKKGIESLMRHSQAGLYEYQLEAYFDWQTKCDGNKDLAFETIAASGKNATILHYVNNNQQLKNDDLILFDLGARTEFYVSDISRTFPISGRFSPRQKEVYEAVLDVNKKCISYLKSGLSWQEFNAYAKSLMIKAAYKLGLIKEDQEISKYYYHSIGHSIGLDTHDPS